MACLLHLLASFIADILIYYVTKKLLLAVGVVLHEAKQDLGGLARAVPRRKP